jgi:hypothetical protein
MARSDQGKLDSGGDDGRAGMSDIADAAQEQMPGKPPNLTYDPSRRSEEQEREAGDRALDEAEREKADGKR